MLQYILTGLAGIAIGVVAMRVWQLRNAAPGEEPAGQDAGEPSAETKAAGAGLPNKLLIGAGVLVVAAIGILVFGQSRETAPAGQSAAGGVASGPASNLDDVDTMIGRLAERLAKEPDDGEGFRMLGWSYVMTGKPDKAIAPYKRALELLPDNATVHSGYGEALVGVAGGSVTSEAKGQFEKALSLDPKEPRARYFLALWLAQNGHEKDALDKWIALANSGPADAPWQADLRARISETSAKLGVDVSSRLKGGGAVLPATQAPPLEPSTIEAASSLPAGERQAMIDDMVDRLATRLKANPKDPDGWIRLLRSRMVLKQADLAKSDLAAARAGLAGDPDGLRRVNAAAAEFGVPGA